MTTTVGVLGAQGNQNTASQDAFRELDLDVFLKLLITELQHQDPMNPMDNQQILEQVSQIREIESNMRLTETLQSVLLGQNLATAGSVIGRYVAGLSDDGEQVIGRVDRISVVDGTPRLHLGEAAVRLQNVSAIAEEPLSLSTEETGNGD